jgi:hypothetical protein
LKMAPQLRLIRDLGGHVFRDMQAVLDLPDEQQTDELLSVILVRATWVVESLGAVMKGGAELFEKGAFLAHDWPLELVREVVELVENFEDVQESIALGLSEEFKKDLESARAEALR